MFQKLINGPSKTVTGAALVIAGAGLLSRLMGLVRDRIFAHYFGAGPIMDAYYASFKIPDLIYNLLIIGALTAGFIPTFTKLFYKSDDKSPAWKLANNIINIAGVTLILLGAIGAFCTPLLAKVIAPGFSESNQALVISFTRIMFLSPIFLGVSMVMGGILQSLRHFTLYAFAPVFYNLGIIIGAIFLVPLIGITGLAWGVALGALFHAGVQLYGARQVGYRWKWYFNIRDPETRLIGKLMIPRTLGVAMTQVNAIIITMIASLLPAGSVAVYNYSNNLQGLPIGVIGISFALAMFPVLAENAAAKNTEEFIKNLSATTRQILFLIIPVSIVLLLTRGQIVRVVLGTGEFGWAATRHTADALAFFALGLFAQALIPLYVRAFYAFENTKTPFVLGVIAELISIIAALLLMKPLGVAGLALAASIGAVVYLGLLLLSLRQLLKRLDAERILRSLYRVIFAGIIMGIVIQYLEYPLAEIVNMTRFWGILLHGFVSATMGLLVYGFICRILRVEEILHLHASLKKRWLRFWNVPAGIDEAEGL
ncbi:MAG TPA: murein biosynthesis integral membrane protein MurJ [Patescibacteria group bacterium]|nr:murein biosynthesis integral membrane protein MurJ [Patescibacteria group bacterium]